MYKILIGSPIRQDKAVLEEFLLSLAELDVSGICTHYLFIDDNDQPASEMLEKFASKVENVSIEKAVALRGVFDVSHYGTQHDWSRALIDRVAILKNHIIAKALVGDYTHVFLIDSDIVLHPLTLLQLLVSKKDIVSNIFWTKIRKEDEFEPQVWMMDQNALYDPSDIRTKFAVYRTRKKEDFLEMLKEPGVYRVGGLGACTLISRKVLEAGVNFSSLYNISFWGEDRSFCIRAVAAGFELYVDTYLPAYHIYRKSNLPGIVAFKKNGFRFDQEENGLSFKERIRRFCKQSKKKICLALYDGVVRLKYRSKFAPYVADQKRRIDTQGRPHITLSMVVKNEADQFYFRKMLTACKRYIDAAVIIDDSSTDCTVEVCEEYLSGVPLKIVRNTSSLFSQEHKLRKLQWKETIKTQPDWILFLDADEIFEERFEREIRALLASDPKIDVYCFRSYDLWDENHYRYDALWHGHEKSEAYLVRYIEGFEYFFSDKDHHCGRLPRNLKYLRAKNSSLRLKHYGWADPKRRQEKYERYMEIDGQGIYGDLAQYRSIMDEHPHLIEWED